MCIQISRIELFATYLCMHIKTNGSCACVFTSVFFYVWVVLHPSASLHNTWCSDDVFWIHIPVVERRDSTSLHNTSKSQHSCLHVSYFWVWPFSTPLIWRTCVYHSMQMWMFMIIVYKCACVSVLACMYCARSSMVNEEAAEKWKGLVVYGQLETPRSLLSSAAGWVWRGTKPPPTYGNH